MATNVHRGTAAIPATAHAGLPGRRFSLRGILDRTTLYWLLTVGILAGYVAVAIALRAFMPENLPYAIALLTTGLGALLALPLRDRLQRSASRMVYGDRNEPYKALSALGARLEASLEPESVPAVVVETVASALRLPYVAIEPEPGAELPFTAFGSLPRGQAEDALLRLPLAHAGSTIAWLALAPRSAGGRFDDADRRLLADLARQAGPAMEAARLTADLRRSRQRLISAREEERRRIRRDLHDGLGPTLAGTLMKMEAARATLADRPDDAQRLLGELAAGTRYAIDEVRRVSYDLRPQALDELGLVGALREQAAMFAGGPTGGLRIDLRVPSTMPPLPAAVEVAAFRIGLEGLTNVVRHSEATVATLEIAARRDEIVVEVRDDGRGIGHQPPGVGLRSMRERAEELGGSLEVRSSRRDGTSVRATLPLHEPA